MNLQEQIHRINEMMGLLTEDKRTKILHNFLDEKINERFGGLTLIPHGTKFAKVIEFMASNDEYDEIFFWNGEILYFENCQLWWDLIELTKMLTMEEKEYEMAIINYFKDRYGIESNEVFQNCDWDMDDVGQI